MEKILIVYWSGTGNTEIMANAMLTALKENNAEAELKWVSEIDVPDTLKYDKIIFGCPAMGDNVLEELEFEPYFAELLPHLKGRKIALFGSYGWYDDPIWMDIWEDRVKEVGALLFREKGLSCIYQPDDDKIRECMEFAKDFINF